MMEKLLKKFGVITAVLMFVPTVVFGASQFPRPDVVEGSITSHRAKITWEQQDNVDHYELRLYTNNCSTLKKIYTVENTKQSKLLKHRKSGTTYCVKVRAFYTDGTHDSLSKKRSFTTLQTCDVYTYQDSFYNGVGQHCLDNIVLRGVYFVAKDQTDEMVTDWQTHMEDIFEKTKTFYESELDNKIHITIEEPVLIYGDNNIADYPSASIMQEEVRSKLDVSLSPDYFSDLTIYYTSPDGSYSGGGVWDSPDNNGSITANPSFWLESNALCTVITKFGTDCYGYISSGHEFGHSLGLAHPWDTDVNKDSEGNIIDPDFHFGDDPGNIMSYSGTELLSGDPNDPFGGFFIMTEEKEKMIASQ